jgi:hypothetical protein
MAGEIKRMHYFNRQFLREADFIAEQEYHMNQRRLHNKELHTWGVSSGLALSFLSGASKADISAGVAFDEEGHEIVLAAAAQTADLSAYQGKTLYITISYSETGSDYTSEGLPSGTMPTRSLEAPLIEVSEIAPSSPGLKLVLGRVILDATGHITSKDDGVSPTQRRSAGAVGGDLEVRSLTLTDPNRASSQWTKIYLGDANRADVQGALSVAGNIAVTGTVDGRDVSVDGAKLDGHSHNGVNSLRIAAGAPGWLKLPFLPKQYSTSTQFINAAYHATCSAAAAGNMEIPVPPGYTKIKNFRIAGVKVGTFRIILYKSGWDGASNIFNTPLLDQTLTYAAPFCDTYAIATSNDIDANYHSLSLYVTTANAADVYYVAAEFE